MLSALSSVYIWTKQLTTTAIPDEDDRNKGADYDGYGNSNSYGDYSNYGFSGDDNMADYNYNANQDQSTPRVPKYFLKLVTIFYLIFR